MAAEKKPHPRTGYRKPDAKRATLALRMTDKDKALLQEQARAAGTSVSDHVVHLAWQEDMAQAARISRLPPCPKCERPDNVVVDYGQLDDETRIPAAVQAGAVPFNCLGCGHEWNGQFRKGPQPAAPAAKAVEKH